MVAYIKRGEKPDIGLASNSLDIKLGGG